MLKKDMTTLCKCGCGTVIKKYRSNYDRQYYVKGHQRAWLGKKRSEETKRKISKSRKGKLKGAKNHKWKGDSVGYHALHSWLDREKEKTGVCQHCGEKRRTVWANKSHEYKRSLDDWLELCQPCHMQYDKETWGEVTKKYL